MSYKTCYSNVFHSNYTQDVAITSSRNPSLRASLLIKYLCSWSFEQRLFRLSTEIGFTGVDTHTSVYSRLHRW